MCVQVIIAALMLCMQARQQHAQATGPAAVLNGAGQTLLRNLRHEDPFNNCGVGEEGIEVLKGETDSPFPSPWCCGNTTWSAFMWRARASPNFLYTGLRGAATPMPAVVPSNATNVCHFKHDGDVLPNCFSFTFNGQRATGNLTPANQWTRWSEFDPNAKILNHRGKQTSVTVATYLCTQEPNSAVDPIRHIELDLFVNGIAAATNASLVTLEIQPHDASQPSYQLNMTAAHIGGVYGGLPRRGHPLALAFFLSRANLTNATFRPLVTEREHFRPLIQALPQDSRAPKTIRINTGVIGMADVEFWRETLVALAGSGYSGITATPAPVLSKIFKEARVQAAMPSGKFGPPLNISKQCGGGRREAGPVDHCWGHTDAEVAASLKTYATNIIAPMKAAGFRALTGISLWDELHWSLPGKWANISNNPRVFAKFHEYVRNHSGFTTPQEFGADSWDDVVPITFVNVTRGLHEKGLRACVYWSVRFAAWDVVTWFAKGTAALVEANGGQEFGIYTNCNNFHGRLFTPGGVSVQASTGLTIPMDPIGGMDWNEAGRYRAGTSLWTEDVSITVALLQRNHTRRQSRESVGWRVSLASYF
jgi:hypothetical protein